MTVPKPAPALQWSRPRIASEHVTYIEARSANVTEYNPAFRARCSCGAWAEWQETEAEADALASWHTLVSK